MAKVSAKIGFTLKIRKDSQYEFIRPEIEISDIDTDGVDDVATQLNVAETALKETWEKVTDICSEEILAKIGDVDQELQLQLQKKFKKIDSIIEGLAKQIAGLTEKK